jgi:zinc finger CCHC domain-containing protein 9
MCCMRAGHALRDCKEPRVGDGTRFAVCFVCKATGHLSSKCPQNNKGVFPKGGACTLPRPPARWVVAKGWLR